ncbi:hypothetical protein ECC02_000197 [Trypanosoma cruzi]|uniref:Uncharacterized protein n=1 Tax=Trypanosoma cruzi TaxID=5693 RepID=A0A7J6YK38_TRYCR|nr:hypothetical protein ECC02_000197 [Trypanosoma cruzi]
MCFLIIGGGCDRIFRSGLSMQFGFHSTGAQWSSCNGWLRPLVDRCIYAAAAARGGVEVQFEVNDGRATHPAVMVVVGPVGASEGFARTFCGPSSSPHFCAEDCAAGSSSAMFGRRNVARTNDLWEGDVHCDENEKKVARRPPPQDRSEVVFFPLARGRPANWSVGRIIFLASLRSLYIPLRFLADLQREICKKFLRGVCAVVGKADSPLKNATF